MAQTPFTKLGSQDILSAHPNGQNYAINNLENVLNMKTTTKNGQALTPVTDMEDSADRYIVYEATDRNWLTSPAPVIYRNGSVVSASEYTIQHAYGAVIFTSQQDASDSITANFTHITGQSTTIESMQAQIDAIEGSSGGGGDMSLLTPQKKVGSYLSHGNPGIMASGIAVPFGTVDLFPMFIYETTTFDAAMIYVKTVGGTNCYIGVYSDNGLFPGTLLASATLNIASTGKKEAAFSGGDLVLQPGIYWLARGQDGSTNTTFDWGLNYNSCFSVGPIFDYTYADATASVYTGIIAYRYFGGATLPATVPALSTTTKYVVRTAYASPWLRVKA